MSNTAPDFRLLVESFHPVIVVDSLEESRLARLLEEISDELVMPIFTWSATEGLCRDADRRALDRSTTHPLAALQYLQQLSCESLFFLKDIAPFLKDPATARQFREVATQFLHTRSCLVVSGHGIELPPEIAAMAAHFELQLPTAEEIGAELDATVRSLQERGQLGAAPTDPHTRESLIQSLNGMTLNQARQCIARAALDDGVIDLDDCWRIIQEKAKQIREDSVLEYFPPGDDLPALGGFDNLKRWLQRATVGFSPEAQALNLEPPKGVLLTGVQGCGKSLAAKLIARDWNVPLLKLDAGRLYNKYIGESERNFRKATRLAESLAPAVLWIDEIEKAFGGGASGGESTDGGTSQRLLGGFLTWLQEKSAAVFVVGTSNDLFALPPEFLRKGRFDEIFFIDLPNAGERHHIFDIHLRRRNQETETFDLAALVVATEGFSGAEIEQAIIAALYESLYQRQPLTTELLLHEIRQTVPLSRTRAEDIQRLRADAHGRFVPVTSMTAKPERDDPGLTPGA
ncbi:MAG: AAA family ATPase [Verrucomicrobiae bacterium]|nr:AAA family ATPase [Verrucomicrobiae bacterium]